MKLIAVGVGLLGVLAVSQHHFPKAVYEIGGPYFDSFTGLEVQDPWDTVLSTRYLDLEEITITTSHVYKARIDCLDVFIQPATHFQTCHQSRDANKI